MNPALIYVATVMGFVLITIGGAIYLKRSDGGERQSGIAILLSGLFLVYFVWRVFPQK